MVSYLPRPLDSTFAALGDPTRLAIIERLVLGEQSVGDLSEPFAMSRVAVGKHVRVLERAGIIETVKVGRERRCRLRPEPLAEVSDWASHQRRFWQERFESLAKFLEKQKKERSKR